MERTAGRDRASTLPTAALLAMVLVAGSGCLPPSLAARMILEPRRHPAQAAPDPPHVEVGFPGEGVELRGWLFPAEGPSLGTVIYLHGRNQNREGSAAVARRLVPLGYDVLAYDSRAHGTSGGRYTTFGYFEKRDVSRAIDFLGVDRVVLAGVSLGAAVAIQSAAEDPRVVGVVAISSFSSLEAVVRERLPSFVPDGQIRRAFRAVERRANIRVKDVDAVAAARRIDVPVLLLHGSLDRFTRIDHAERIYGALRGPRDLVEIAGAGHGDVLASDRAWDAILGWFASLDGRAGRHAAHVDRLDAQVHVGAAPRRRLDDVGERVPVARPDAGERVGEAAGAGLEAIRAGRAERPAVQVRQQRQQLLRPVRPDAPGAALDPDRAAPRGRGEERHREHRVEEGDVVVGAAAAQAGEELARLAARPDRDELVRVERLGEREGRARGAGVRAPEGERRGGGGGGPGGPHASSSRGSRTKSASASETAEPSATVVPRSRITG
jgi:alpha-beta hydrolase superfamily lysophospholipase